jgi:hypothetical protein
MTGALHRPYEWVGTSFQSVKQPFSPGFDNTWILHTTTQLDQGDTLIRTVGDVEVVWDDNGLEPRPVPPTVFFAVYFHTTQTGFEEAHAITDVSADWVWYQQVQLPLEVVVTQVDVHVSRYRGFLHFDSNARRLAVDDATTADWTLGIQESTFNVVPTDFSWFTTVRWLKQLQVQVPTL